MSILFSALPPRPPRAIVTRQPWGRRALLRGALVAPALLLTNIDSNPNTLWSSEGPSSSDFGPDTVQELARLLAARPHRPREAPLPPAFAQLDYDGYRKIRFDAAQAIWAEAGLPFQLQPHHRGFLFQPRVELFEVADGRALPIRFQRDQFRYEGVAPPAEDDDLGFAGFRLLYPLNRADHFDEVCSFLGASYFRAIGRGHVYGLSARGLTIGTAEAGGEEFPAFTAFWLVRPKPGETAFTLHALLESESLTGAFRFIVTPGDSTAMEVASTLFPRRAVPRIGAAPGTSMFFFGPQDRTGVSDYRPAVHDSDGLLMTTGQGEQLWRPLTNPQALQVSGFQDASPRGFGLLQRTRSFASFQDIEAAYHRRPGLWVEPMDDWGPGEVQLVEIPTRSEVHDNIVAAWSPRGGLSAGNAAAFRYRLHWRGGDPGDARLLRFDTTRLGSIGQAPLPHFVLDTSALGPLSAEGATAALTASAGQVKDAVVQANPETGGLRLSFSLQPGRARLVELSARLLRGATPLSESWAFRWTG